MRVVDRYPDDAVTGGCFLLGRYRLEPGEQVIDLDIDVDNLPAYGRLCISEDAVTTMANLLGWRLITEQFEQRVRDSERHAAEVQAEYDELVAAVRGIADIRVVRKALEVISKRELVDVQ